MSNGNGPIDFASFRPTEEAAPASATPDVVAGGTGFRVKKPGEPANPRLDVEQLRDENVDLRRRVSGLTTDNHALAAEVARLRKRYEPDHRPTFIVRDGVDVCIACGEPREAHA